MNLEKDLNPEQLRACQTLEGPVLIIAGAGSGKTRTLTYRLAYLIEQGIRPEQILAVTFTNKAAGEMKTRVASLLSGKTNSAQPFVGTFHSFCVRILRQEITVLDFKKSFAIYDTDDQLRTVKAAMKEVNISTKQFAPQMILSLISKNKNELIEPENLADKNLEYIEKIVAKIYPVYQRILKTNNALDFDDLLMKTVKIFEANPEILKKYQKQYQYILVDEYQDTNHAQYKLVMLLADKHRNICVVGDDAQSIYGFRGADIRNILNFEKDFPEAVVVKLEQNYRSTKNILDVANEVIAANTKQMEKKLWTKNPPGEEVKLSQVRTEYDEGKTIIETVEALKRRGVIKSLSEVAILYRTNAQSRAIEEMFLQTQTPYQIVGGVRFYERKEIKDIIAYLRLLQNPNDEISLARIINEPARYIGHVTLNRLLQARFEHHEDFLTLITYIVDGKLPLAITPTAKNSLKDFVNIFNNVRALTKPSLTEVFDQITVSSGYKKYLQDGTDEGETRWENVMELKSLAAKYDGLPLEEALTTFLEEIALMSDIDQMRDEKNSVTLMTCHAAKGLEFPVIFVIGVEEGLFPHTNSMMDASQIEEERRLFYVGITRAMKNLFLLLTHKRTIFGQTNYSMPSRFLDAIKSDQFASTEDFNDVVPFSDEILEELPHYNKGDVIDHPYFGEGVVKNYQNGILEITFQRSGNKKIAAAVAPLTVKNKGDEIELD
ncbi:MAG: UvrD-helicase domain-containing protein [bacterium]